MKECTGVFRGYNPKKNPRAELYKELGLVKGEKYKIMYDRNLPYGGCRVYVWRTDMYHPIDYNSESVYQTWKFTDK